MFLCAAKDRVLFLESKTTNPGSYYGNDHDFTWVTVHLDTARVVRDSIARLKVSRDPERLFNEAVRLDHGNRTALYNLACAKARLGEAARAVAYLQRLPDVAETRRKVRNDKDFDGIRGSPELRKFMSGASDGGP